jgi:hypothetical protein
MVQLGKIRLAACIRSPVRIQIGAPGCDTHTIVGSRRRYAENVVELGRVSSLQLARGPDILSLRLHVTRGEFTETVRYVIQGLLIDLCYIQRIILLLTWGLTWGLVWCLQLVNIR